MPIYAYSCSSCGLQKDVMQKINDMPFSTCPECGKNTFAKQVTAASFLLKGSGYYVTDFKGGPPKPQEGKAEAAKAEPDKPAPDKPVAGKSANAPTADAASGAVAQ